ncbi:uncharacterized protein BDZ83DRAFT_649207 [Colletotrichum acutatum]|uniref:Uncharacterized protein n=1 Tax=Glomerella acutata TaxID=27357 RepID=A0AAD8XHW3_GLOAC|nr:uncharacterized protein BDZ83DRAFT_649207 [Colletotrichum acutatum]KAK1727842.1 hypothetical protein BDZ83DRAFT_649207 [Colletotrichum acutatum]
MQVPIHTAFYLTAHLISRGIAVAKWEGAKVGGVGGYPRVVGYRHRTRPRQNRYPTLAHIRRRERITLDYFTSSSIVGSSGRSPQGKRRCGLSSRQLQFYSSEPHISNPSPGPRPSTRRSLDPNRTPFHHHSSFPLTTHETQRTPPTSFLLHPSTQLRDDWSFLTCLIRLNQPFGVVMVTIDVLPS